MWENRAIYFTELNRLGAQITLADPHRVFVTGRKELKSAQVVSPPALRPAMIILIGMLGASGTSILRNVYMISRGYEEIAERLKFMDNVGIEYLTLDRRAHTLSGGEAQRIRLASQLGSGLVGATYVLDEPTIGLHSRDNNRLVKTLLDLRDLGNTVLVVEHDAETMLESDYIFDLL
jgi:ABC-type branched-subunit amino acid transport system ATPase component